MTFKKGDHVIVVTDEFEFTPDGNRNTGYGPGVTGIIAGFRTNRFHGRQAIVKLDAEPGMFVDWTLDWIEKVES